MSRRVVAVIFVFLLVVVAAALGVTFLQKTRMNSHLAATRNNLRQLALFASHNANPDPNIDRSKFPSSVPPGTVVLPKRPDLPPEERLSWFVHVLPGLDQRQQDIVSLITMINDQEPWSAERNQQAARVRLVVALSTIRTPPVPADAPAPTCYVGIAGIGADAATLALSPGRAPARAAAFRYDAPTPFDRIGDGLSQTLLLGETTQDIGPWLCGGLGTVRGLIEGPDARPLIGDGGQFGGYFPAGAHFALCDGSVRLITRDITPHVLLRMATIDEGDQAAVPD